MNSRKSKLTLPLLNQSPPFIPAIPSSMRPPSRHMKRRRRCVLFPDIGNLVNSVTRGNVTGDPLPSMPDIHAAHKLHGKKDAATFLSATDRARLFGINKW